MKNIRGFTIVELMIVITIVAIAVALAIPSFRDLIERKAVSGAAEAVYEQVQLARAEALKRSKPILVDFYIDGADATNWAIGITDKMAGCDAEDTSGADLCTVDYDNVAGTADPIAMRIVGTDYRNITMSQATAFPNPSVGMIARGCITTTGEQACFDSLRGLALPGVYQFASANYNLRVEVSLLGNVRVCLPTGSGIKKIPGYIVCA